MTKYRALIFSLSAMVLSACVSPQTTEVSKHEVGAQSWPAMKAFPNGRAANMVYRANTDILQEFLDLSFSLESGQRIPRLTRFEGPITVAFANPAKPVVSRDLDQLITRLRDEANLDISRISNAKFANIVIETMSKRDLQRAAPSAACIVVPRIRSWAEFRKNRFNKRTDWSSLERRERAMIFMPHDISAQDARDCLHEELAQALGPLNDLYRLPDSVYNDDNFHIVLTAYDMMILRAYYAPEIRNGMAQHEAAAVLPRVLARVNPAGSSITAKHLEQTDRSWIKTIEAALGVKGNDSSRIAAADRALKIAKQAGYRDHRLGFSYFARARVSISANSEQAAADFARSYAVFNDIFGPNNIHTAQAALQMASLSISAGRYDTALEFINDSIPAAKSAQNGRLLFSLLAMKAEVVTQLGRSDEATALRREAISWGRYGIVPAREISDRLKTIAKLKPAKPA